MPEVMPATGHAGFVTTVAFSPDEKLLASGSYDTTVKLWDLATGIELRTFKGHKESVVAVAFSPDGRTIASAGEDGIVNLWDISTGIKRVLNYTKFSDAIEPDLKFTFSEDGNRLLLDVTGTIIIWDIATRRKRTRIEDSSAISQDWKLVAFEKDNTIEIRRVDTRAIICKLSSQGSIQSINFSPDGKLLVSTSSDQSIKIWSVPSGEIIWTFTEPSGRVFDTAFSRDNQTLATFSSHQALLWDLASGKEIKSIKNQDEMFRNAAFSPNLDVIAAWDGSKFGWRDLELWDLKGTQNIRVLLGHDEGIVKAVFSPSGATVATCSYDNTVRIWDVNKDLSQKTLKGGVQGIGDIEISQDGKMLAMHFYATNTIKLWAIGAGKEPWQLDFAPTPSEGYFTQGLSPSGNFYVTGFSPVAEGRDAPKPKVEVKIWDTVTRRDVAQLPDHASVPNLAFSPTEEVIATLDEGTIRIWDLRTGQKIRTIYTSSDTQELFFSLSGKTIVVSDGSTITLWNCRTGKKILTIPSQDRDRIAKNAFSTNDDLIAGAVCSDTCSIKLWNAKTGKLLGTLKRYAPYSEDGSTYCSISFSPDGRLVSVVSAEIFIAADTAAQTANWQRVDLFDTRTRRKLKSLDYDDPSTFRLVSSLVPATYSNIFNRGRFKISIGDNSKLGISDVKTGRLLVELLVLDKDDWLTVAPDGLFDGTPEAWNKIRWRFNDNTFDYASLEAFYSDYYRPGLLDEILAGNHPTAPSNLSQKDRRPIGVILKAPPFDSTQPDGSRTVTVQVEVKESPAGPDISDKTKQLPRSGARDLRLFRNGSLVKLWSGDLFTRDEKDGCKQTQITPENPRSSICRATIPIVAGENKLVAYAFNDANVKSDNATLTITGPDTLTRKGTLHILAIGVGRYTNAAFDLNYTPDDALSFASQLKLQQEKLQRYQAVEVTAFLNENATKENILAELMRLSGASQPEDGVVMYFSGHGKASGDHFYLMPHDIGYSGPRDQLSDEGLQQILRHSISDLNLEKAFRDIDAENILMIIDACNSGQALENKEEPRRGPMNTRGLAQLAYEKGMHILTASQNVEEAFVSEGLKYSYLTYVLIDGLKTNSADLDGNGDITLREWFDYAAARVPKLREETLERKSLEEVIPAVKLARSQKSQTPRVFYRKEPDARPFIVASSRPTH